MPAYADKGVTAEQAKALVETHEAVKEHSVSRSVAKAQRSL